MLHIHAQTFDISGRRFHPPPAFRISCADSLEILRPQEAAEYVRCLGCMCMLLGLTIQMFQEDEVHHEVQHHLES